MRVKALIFDLDGTIADTLPLCISAFRASIEPLIQRSLSDEEIIATFGPSEEGTIMALAPDSYEAGISSYLRFYEELHEKCPNPFEGIADILEEMSNKGIRMAMVTGKGEHSTKISLDLFSLGRYFPIIETGSPSGPRKVQGITSVLDQWTDIEKSEIVYVGDAPSDIIACRQVGISIVAAAWADTAEPEVLRNMHPDELFLRIGDFRAWLSSVL